MVEKATGFGSWRRGKFHITIEPPQGEDARQWRLLSRLSIDPGVAHDKVSRCFLDRETRRFRVSGFVFWADASAIRFDTVFKSLEFQGFD